MSPEPRIARATGAKAWSSRDRLTVLAREGRALRFEGASADLALAVFEMLALPHTRDEVIARVEAMSGAPLASATPVDELLAAFASIRATTVVREGFTSKERRARVVLAVSGAVAAAHAPTLLTRMLASQGEVRLAATRSALRFVARDALEAIASSPLRASHWSRGDRTRAHHIELAEWAEVMVVFPASATTIARIATGDCSDVVSATAIATRAPVVLAPSMNAAMYAAPSVERNLRQLREDGFHLVVPAAGVEVAHAPEDRAPMLGPAPSTDDVFEIARAVLAEARRAQTSLPTDRDGWDSLYRGRHPSTLSWHRGALEDDLALTLSALASKGHRALDLGTGSGLVASALAGFQCTVTAVDLSSVAIERASLRGVARLVGWVVGDVTEALPAGPFDLIVDRGCLHCLPRERHVAWREQVARVSAPGARLVALVHDESESSAATNGYGESSLRAFLDPLCEELRVTASRMGGDLGPSRNAWLCVGRVRRGA